MEYDVLIIGSGFTGCVIARKLAEENDKKVLLIERRDHIAGNMYDEYNEANILVQRYGPHVFHTNNEKVFEFVSKYSEWEPYKVVSKVTIDGKILPSPFNYTAIDEFYSIEDGKELKSRLECYYPNKEAVTVVELLESEDDMIRNYANLLFEKDYRPYTSKQWGIAPEEIDVSVLKRCPVFLSYRETYLNEKYECLPSGGFTKLFEKMLNHPNITVRTGVDALNYLRIDFENNDIYYDGELIRNPIVYTGPLDELLSYKYGALPYRSLRFEWKTFDVESYQPVSILVYPQEKDFTRITEYTKMPVQNANGKTTIAIEFPIQYIKGTNSEPYYPIVNENNNSLYAKYFNDIKTLPNLYVCGRLGDYKYYNMDQAVLRALEVAEEIQEKSYDA